MAGINIGAQPLSPTVKHLKKCRVASPSIATATRFRSTYARSRGDWLGSTTYPQLHIPPKACTVFTAHWTRNKQPDNSCTLLLLSDP